MTITEILHKCVQLKSSGLFCVLSACMVGGAQDLIGQRDAMAADLEEGLNGTD